MEYNGKKMTIYNQKSLSFSWHPVLHCTLLLVSFIALHQYDSHYL